MIMHNNLGEAINGLVHSCFRASFERGWWDIPEWFSPDPNATVSDDTQYARISTPIKIALIHSEISEAMEGDRKNKQDDHLPHRSSLEVELADAVIRICDLAGARGLDLGGAILEKMAYNAKRRDHDRDHRAAEGGKSY